MGVVRVRLVGIMSVVGVVGSWITASYGRSWGGLEKDGLVTCQSK